MFSFAGPILYLSQRCMGYGEISGKISPKYFNLLYYVPVDSTFGVIVGDFNVKT